MTALSVTSHVLLMTNIPADQPLGGGWTGVVFWSKLNTRLIVSSALNMGYMLPKFHGHIQVVDLPRISTLPLHGLHPIFQEVLVLCQDLVQVKMRNFSDFNPPEAQPQCVFFHTLVRIHLVTYSYNGYEFVSYCRKLPDIRKSSGMPACNREF